MLGTLHSPLLNELVLRVLVWSCTRRGPAVQNTQQEILELVLPFNLQQDIECVCEGDSHAWQVIRLQVGGGLVQSHADVEVSFSDHKLNQPERRGEDESSQTEQGGGKDTAQVKPPVSGIVLSSLGLPRASANCLTESTFLQAQRHHVSSKVRWDTHLSTAVRVKGSLTTCS